MAISNRQQEGVQDAGSQLKRASQEAHLALNAQDRKILESRMEFQSSASEAQARLQQLEDRCVGLEARMLEMAGRQRAGFERLSERSEGVAQLAEQAKLGGRSNAAGSESTMAHVQELELMIRESEAGTMDLLAKERQAREEELRAAQQNIIAQQQTVTTNLEVRLFERLEKESVLRSAMVSQVMGDVGSAIEHASEHVVPKPLGQPGSLSYTPPLLASAASMGASQSPGVPRGSGVRVAKQLPAPLLPKTGSQATL